MRNTTIVSLYERTNMYGEPILTVDPVGDTSLVGKYRVTPLNSGFYADLYETVPGQHVLALRDRSYPSSCVRVGFFSRSGNGTIYGHDMCGNRVCRLARVN